MMEENYTQSNNSFNFNEKNLEQWNKYMFLLRFAWWECYRYTLATKEQDTSWQVILYIFKIILVCIKQIRQRPPFYTEAKYTTR